MFILLYLDERLLILLVYPASTVPIYGIFAQNGIFIWWPKVEHVNVTSYLIQFQSNEPTNFSDHIIGTTKVIDEFQTWSDIVGHLTKVSAVTNVHPQPGIDYGPTDKPGEKHKNGNHKLITEIRVGGEVTGILIPNTAEIVVRILVPILDEDGELVQDTQFVEWKKVCSILLESVFIFFKL